MTKQDCAMKVCEALCGGDAVEDVTDGLERIAEALDAHGVPGFDLGFGVVAARDVRKAIDWLERWGAAAEAPDAMGAMIKAVEEAIGRTGGPFRAALALAEGKGEKHDA